MNLVWLQNAAGIVRTRKKILTMAIKKQLQKSPTIILFCNFFFLASQCCRFVEPIYKNNKNIFRLQ